VGHTPLLTVPRKIPEKNVAPGLWWSAISGAFLIMQSTYSTFSAKIKAL
jgi:hypothetical protein